MAAGTERTPEHDTGAQVEATVETVADGVARVAWRAGAGAPGTTDAGAPTHGDAVEVVRRRVEDALTTHARVETLVAVDDEAGQRVATWSGLRREGVMRGVTVAGEPVDRVVYARLATDRPAHEPDGFRELLNSFLPRKRAISQMLLRDHDGRVLLCQLTYKRDWDLPGGVVEVGESPQVAVAREVEEELGLQVEAGALLLTDWLPAWAGWDDALCLVFDGGVHDAAVVDDIVRQEREIRHAAFCSLDEVEERCADFTARRIRSALASLDGGGTAYTESGR
ncbi:NUDIX domain-containing protein [Nocardioides perillae]|uniref:8-oxo-dGTP pyrophosphatase MutT (NUDIX family) n=1 Tax=Nocardioides perillae TaxID=1119534 RepID=A0A7Y9RVS9_9ACTN|nr:NUDIX hydrolase [Nocardioides perillae]NYG55478.1 8-oxo-dGTP pyrophosphatase MutT (NUDIX family) [Nocardioides perillae]